MVPILIRCGCEDFACAFAQDFEKLFVELPLRKKCSQRRDDRKRELLNAEDLETAVIEAIDRIFVLPMAPCAFEERRQSVPILFDRFEQALFVISSHSRYTVAGSSSCSGSASTAS